ncbi:hypothetical protein [Halomarina oriensis]|uniref:Uncharacterized protein n=1 Tax=Halomarina oriensis TaxID=671145 RepID=A0A6B0GVS2_9EURY|nr:hypothetical protein [Halomarina oriensis]MWG36235.1 hypothetical protein [Halomarina oriensis]
MNRVVQTLLVACLLVATVAGVAPIGATPTASAETTCETRVVHDAFRTDESTIRAAANVSAASVRDNTRVTVEQAPGFVRVKGENPNGYCVRFVIELSERVVAPSEVGEVGASNGNQTAMWRAMADFEGNETYTSVEFTLGAHESVTFAPSSARIETLSWAAKAKETGSGLFDGAQQFWNDLFHDDLEQRSYEFSPESESTKTITVSLTNDTDGRTVEEWLGYYRVGEDDWRPISKDVDDPAFYREPGDETVQFTFTQSNVSVKFVANPDHGDKFDHQLAGYRAGFGDLGGFFGGIGDLFGALAIDTTLLEEGR